MNTFLRLMGVAALALGSVAAEASHTYTIPTDSRLGNVGESGADVSGSDMFGQTFTFENKTLLHEFSIFLNDRLNTDTVDFFTEIRAWDVDTNRWGTTSFYTSGNRVTSNNSGSDGFCDEAPHAGCRCRLR